MCPATNEEKVSDTIPQSRARSVQVDLQYIATWEVCRVDPLIQRRRPDTPFFSGLRALRTSGKTSARLEAFRQDDTNPEVRSIVSEGIFEASNVDLTGLELAHLSDVLEAGG